MTKNKDIFRPLGEFIVQCTETNSNGVYTVGDVCGMTITKEVIPTKANLEGTDISKFIVVYPNQFIYNPRTHGKRIGLAYNETGKPFLISWNNVAFKVIDENILLPQYLYMYFHRMEWDRQACFMSWGSSTEVFSWGNLCLMKIPVPSIDRQKELVALWQGTRNLKQQNEQLAEPLMQLCQSYLQELKKKYPAVDIRQYIHRVDKRNSDKKVKIVKSVSVTKEFNDTNAKVDKSNLAGYKIVEDGQISFVQTTSNEKRLCMAVNHFGYPIVVTSVNEVFATDEKYLLADYLHLWVRRKEFDRYARFHSWGSAREIFDWADMCNVKIPLPPVEIQKAIVAVYQSANEAKSIATEANTLTNEICPALVQEAING